MSKNADNLEFKEHFKRNILKSKYKISDSIRRQDFGAVSPSLIIHHHPTFANLKMVKNIKEKNQGTP